jgi:osmotically-inducible protein OsmY
MSGSTSSGLFGSRSLGQGTTSRSGSSFGGSGASAAPGNAVEQAQADAGQASGDERFIRENRQPGAFVGADTADTTTFFGQSQGAALSGLEQFASAAAQRDFQNQNSNSNSRIQLRPKLVLGFRPPAAASRDIRVRFSQRLAKLPQLEILENVEVAIVGRTAVLRGRVATDYDRQMIAQIASLEPGVAVVQNDLQVGQANSQQQSDVLPLAEQAPMSLPKSAAIDTPAMNQPELAAPPPPRAPQAD